MVGLVDYDWQTSTSLTRLIPNLEIMKIATYYRIEKNTFCRLLSLEEEDLSVYEKIYFFSEAESSPQIPSHFLKAKNMIYGGTAFTGNYQPFEESIIDYTIARPLIYKDVLKQKYSEGAKAKVVAHVLDDSYYRMYAGDAELPVPPIRKNKKLYLFDKEVFHPGWQSVIKKIEARSPSSIVPIHPIICRTMTNYWDLRATSISRAADVVLDMNIPLEETGYMVKRYKNKLLADIQKNTPVYLPLGGTFSSDFQYFKDFIYKLNLLYVYWSVDIPIKIKYQYPAVGYNNPLEALELLVELWARTEARYEVTLYDRTCRRVNKELKKTLNEQRELLCKFYPTAKSLFKQNYNNIKQGGLWRP